jgi:hypothetical protein
MPWNKGAQLELGAGLAVAAAEPENLISAALAGMAATAAARAVATHRKARGIANLLIRRSGCAAGG